VRADVCRKGVAMVDGAGSRASGGILVVGASGVVVEGRQGLDSGGGDFGQWRDATTTMMSGW